MAAFYPQSGTCGGEQTVPGIRLSDKPVKSLLLEHWIIDQVLVQGAACSL